MKRKNPQLNNRFTQEQVSEWKNFLNEPYMARAPTSGAGKAIRDYVMGMKEKLENRPERVQGQVILHGPSLLEFLSTNRYDALIMRITDPEEGMAGFRAKSGGVPRFMGVLENLDILNGVLRLLVHRRKERDEAGFREIAGPVEAMLNGKLDTQWFMSWVTIFYLDLLKERSPLLQVLDEEFQEVSWVRPNPRPGDVLLWRGFHRAGRGSATPAPHMVAILDYVPVKHVHNNDGCQMKGHWDIFKETAVDLGSGSWSNREPRMAAQRGRQFDISERLDARQRALLGEPDNEGTCVVGDMNRLVWEIAAQRNTTADLADAASKIRTHGFAIVPGAKMGGDWEQTWTAARDALLAYFNWVVFDKLNPGFKGPRFILDDEEGECMDWALLAEGTKTAAKLTGESHFLYQRLASGERTTVARGGGIVLPREIGLGPATSAYDVEAKLKLETHPSVHALFAGIYNEPVHAIPERFRLKANISGGFAAHSDALYQ